jgi:hypothetical protein
MNRPVVYLDYDGVLHPEDVFRHPKRGVYLSPRYAGHKLFEHCGLLEAELEPYPDVVLVLSTTWVRVLRYRRALSYLPDSLQMRVVGATFHSAMHRPAFEALSRGQQVLADVGRRKPSDWLALDDDAEHWPDSHRERLVRTDPTLGLSSAIAELRHRLRNLGGAA